jgi:hypothetical protein
MLMMWRTSWVLQAAYVGSLILALGLLDGVCCWSQVPAALPTLEGLVVDPTGARVANAAVHAQPETNAESTPATTTTNRFGRFALRLPAGSYDLTIEFTGFAPFQTTVVVPTRGDAPRLHVELLMPVHREAVVVGPNDAANLSARNNPSALVFRKDDLKAFSDDDTTFQQEIIAMAGGSGSKDFELLVDGFSNDRFPPKTAIRSIRINRNSYSAQYDKYGQGRVEVSSQPGGEQFHGNVEVSGNDGAFNSGNPYAHGAQPASHFVNTDASLTGPLVRKTTFSLDGVFSDLQNNAIVDTDVLFAAVPAPMKSGTISARIDRQMTSKNTLFGRYQFDQSQQVNGGVGALVLPSQGINSTTTTQTLQLSDTQVISGRIVSQSRFQYLRLRTNQTPASNAPAIVVEGSFNDGGSPAQALRDNQDRYEFQEYLSVEAGKNFLRLGGRYRLLREANLSTAAYNGQFTFPSLQAYQETVARTAFGATQFNLTTGQSSAVVLTGDLGAYAEDEWKARTDLTLMLGFRMESQSAIPDHLDPAPHLGFSWSVGRTSKRRPFFTLRGGAGFFYHRFDPANLLIAIRRQSGTLQPSYTVENPKFYFTALPPMLPSTISLGPPTLYNIDPNLHCEYGLYSGVSLDRNVGKLGTFSLSYHFVRGDHQFLSRNINAPLPGTYIAGDPGSGVRPLGGTQNIYQFGSPGIAKMDIVDANTHLQAAKRLAVFAFGSIDLYNHNDAPDANSFPTNQYKASVDFARPATPRAQFFTGGTLQLPFGLTDDAFVSLQAGAPFNITTGTDLNGDTIYNDRPTFATAASPAASVYHTRYGAFDATPQPGEKTIPYNYAAAPGIVFIEMELARSFKFGPHIGSSVSAAAKKPEPPADLPFNLSFDVAANNLINHVNPGAPVGVLGSPLFGKSISLNPTFAQATSANRWITLRTVFTF